MTQFLLKQFASSGSLSGEMADLLGKNLQGTGPVSVMLSGGRTPLMIYEELCSRGQKASPEVRVLYSDERHVPADSPDNNYGATVPLLSTLAIPDSRVFRVHTELEWTESAARYHQDLRRFMNGTGRITLGILGLGADGHTASLFTPEDVERGDNLYAVAVPREPGPNRISVTPELLRRVERLVILISGPEKQAIVTRLIHSPEAVVAGLALRDAPEVEIWQA
jgi:6-phosphogluconolactonase/glucosamine-6-phosphate isomerase/deaminase